MLFNVLLLIMMMKSSLSTTSIKTYPTVNLTENVPLNTKVVKLIEENIEIKYKLILLNLVGYEINYFEIQNETIYTINEIDREEFINKKRCFDPLNCLIELHILINDGKEYWIIPIHIIDENDNKPLFKNNLIELKLIENNLNENQILFDGGIDYDEGINNKINYILDCSNKKEENLNLNNLIKEKENLINCFPLFNLIIFSKNSLINQYDQLGLKYNLSLFNRNEYELILYSFNLNKINLINSMKIKIKIEHFSKKKIHFFEYKFLIKNENFLNKNEIIGKIPSNNTKTIYRIINETNNNLIKINSLTGELIILNNINFNLNEINLLIESFNNNNNIKSLINIKIIIRLLNKINLLINYQFNYLFIQQFDNKIKNNFLIKKENFIKNEILLNLTINSSFYLSDQFIISLFNYNDLFSLISLNKNSFSLKLNEDYEFNSNLLLIIKIKHQITNEYLSNLTIQFIPNILCLQNSQFEFYDFNQTNLLGNFEIIETNKNISSFTNFDLLNNQMIIINQCQMLIKQLNYSFLQSLSLSSSQFKLCSLINEECFNITSNQISFQTPFFQIRSIELIIFILIFIFILSIITLIIIIYRFNAFHLCLTIKNYLFYGKKYGINNAQRLSSNKITERIHSIVVRESHSPSIEHIKCFEQPYIFNLNQYIQQETTIPTIHLNSSSSPQTSTSSTNPIDILPQTSIIQETKELLDILSSNHHLHQHLDLSNLASDV